MRLITNSLKILFVSVIALIGIGCSNDSNSNDKTENTINENPKLKSAISAGIITKEMYSEKSPIDDKIRISKELDLTKLQPGTILRFGSSDKEYTQVEARINADSTIDLVYNYRWAINGNRDFIKERMSTGKYKLSYHNGEIVKTDNEYHPLHQNVIMLINNDLTRENGYSDIGRSFLIGKSRSREDTSATPVIRLYPWQDPKYYPSGNFYNFLSSLELYEIDYVK